MRGGNRVKLALASLLAACASAALALPVVGQPDDEKAPALRPGLVVTYRDEAKPAPHEHVAIEPGIALFLNPGESPHPTVAPENLTVRWIGRLRILRADKYAFTANVQGRFKLSILGKDVLNQPPLSFVPGSYPLLAEFVREPGKPAQVQVFWQAKHFAQEPLPLQHLEHQPEQLPERWETVQLIERGRRLVEDYGCMNCHKLPGGSNSSRQGPNLSKAGEWLRPAWLNAWVRHPRQLRSHAAMPRLLAEGDAEAAEAYALTQFFTALGGPFPEDFSRMKSAELRLSLTRGEKLFGSIGCSACHSPDATTAAGPARPLAIPGQGQRTGVTPLARFLQNPRGVNPGGRMPAMLLSPSEAADVARFLCSTRDVQLEAPEAPTTTAAEFLAKLEVSDEVKAAIASLPGPDQWRRIGEQLVVGKRCNACHVVEVNGKPLPLRPVAKDWSALRELTQHDQACLATTPVGAGVPRFDFSASDRQAIDAYLKSPRRVNSAPVYDARRTLERLNCLACHVRDGEGGLSTAQVDLLKQYESAENAEAVSPPPLTGVGHKLQLNWMKQVLLHAGRARPWMSLRMPQYGEDCVGSLPEALTACDGIDPLAKDQGPPFKASDVEPGRYLVGKKAFGCIACHDLAGVPSGGTRGPDLALVQQRIRFPWYRRWLEQPLRMQPGTRMPSVFTDGRSLMDEVLGGQADAQAAATWNYLSLGVSLRHPEGLEPPRGLAVVVKDKPTYLRTFLPDVGTRAIAVGFPEQVAIAFDAGECRLAYAWSGNFLDAGPTWNDRGGSPARLLGPRFWQAPYRFPWAFTASLAAPEFTAPRREAALDGHGRPRFRGYAMTPEGWPIFQYEADGPESKPIAIEETVRPRRSGTAVGLTRAFVVQAPPGVVSWLLAVNGLGGLRLLDENARSVAFDEQAAAAEKPGRMVILSEGDKRTLVRLDEAPPGSTWHVSRQDGRWQVALRVPAREDASSTHVSVTHWQPHRPDDAAWQELMSDK